MSISGICVGILSIEDSKFLNKSSVGISFPEDRRCLNESNMGISLPKENMSLNGNILGKSISSNIPPALVAMYYIKLFLFMAGSLGNLLSLCVWMTKDFRAMPRSIICFTLAVANTIYLTLMFTNATMQHFFKEYLLSSSDITCRMKTTILGLTQHTDSWNIVFLSVERLAAIFIPLHMKIIFDRRKAVMYVALTTVIFLAFNIYVDMNDVSVLTLPNGNTRCKTMISVRFHIKRFLIDLIPLLIIIPCNIVIVVKVISQYRKMKHCIALTQQQITKKKSIKVSILTLSITLSFIILFVPNIVFFLCCRNLHTEPLTRSVFALLPMINASCNCYMYALASKDYRLRAKTVSKSMCPQNTVHTIQ